MLHDTLVKIGLTKKFRDPIYGFIRMSDAETKIIDTPLFQRLRRIHQLALENYVYHGAEHSRFGHSLGVLHTATEVIRHLLDITYSEESANNVKEIFCMDRHNLETTVKTIRFAALLHDIGHLPFSHATETKLLNGVKHEDISKYIILNYEPIKDILKGEEVEPEEVAALIKSDPGDIPNFRLTFMKEIISGNFDADRADYLLRDSYYCGVKYGVYDYARYISALRLSDVNSISFNIRSDNVPIVEEFLMARYQYNIQVPFHHTRKALDICIEGFISSNRDFPLFKDFSNIIDIRDKKIDSMDFDKFTYFDDYSFFYFLNSDPGYNDFWSQCLKRENHLRMVTEEIGEGDAENFNNVIKKLRKNSFTIGMDFFKWTTDLSLCKFDEGLQFEVCDREWRPIAKLEEYSVIFKHLGKNPSSIRRIYAVPDKAEEIMAVINS